MAQWDELNKLCQANSSIHEKFVEICRRLRFPYKIRCRFAAWIEQQDWSIDVNADNGKYTAECLQRELLSKIQMAEEAMRNEIPYELEKVLDIQLAKKEIESLDVKSFTNALKLCLHEEKMLIQSCSNERKETKCKGNDANQSERLQELRRKVQDMLKEIINAETCVGRISQDQELLVDSIGKETANIDKRICAAPTAKKAELNNQKQKMLAEHEKVLKEHFARRSGMVDSMIHLAIQLAYLLQTVWSEIRKWQNDQKYISVGLNAQPPKDSLDAIDVICEEVSNILNRVIMQVEKAITVYQRYPNRAASNSSDDETSKLILVNTELIKDYLPRHLHCLFIVEQNLEGGILCLDEGKSGQFKITLRFLGGKAFGLGFSRPTVKMFLKSARELNVPVVTTDGAVSGVGGDCSFTVDMPTGRCRAEFQGVHIENLRPSVTGTSATGGRRFDKHAFLFQTVVHVCGRDIPLQTISHPVIVTNNQMESVVARGVLVWDAAFSEPGRRPFVYKDMVHWPEFAQMLSSLFVNATGRELSVHHIDYLARLLFNDRSSHDFSARHVREKSAIYDNMSGRKFSFWAWFWANLALCRDIVNSEWRAGLIYGFISKEDARSKLQDMPRGTFLLRFSESDIDNPDKHSNDSWSERKCNVYGYLTIAVIESDPQNSVAKKLFYIKDYLSPKDLMEKGLSEILLAMEVADRSQPNVKVQLLNHLWPDTNKTVDETFDIFRRQNGSSDPTEDEDGYKTSKFAIQIFLSEAVGGGRVLRGSSMQRHDSNSSMSTVMSHDSMCSDDVSTIVTCDSSSPSPQYAVRVDTARRVATVNPQPSSVPRVQAAVRQMLPATPGMHHAGINATIPAAVVFDEESMDSVSSDMSSASGLQMGMVNTIALFNLNGGGQS